MKCPFCRETASQVYNSRTTRFGTQIWRRRRCMSCSKSFTTYEQPDLGFLNVSGPSGRPEPYNRIRLFNAVYACFETTQASPDTIDAVTDTIEAKILDLKKPNITTAEITSIILYTLKHYHIPAFLRFLSSHASISSNAEIKRELKKYN